MGLKSRDGVDIKDYWKNGIRAYLGTNTAGFPNAFMTYTPLSPTALSNGTTIIESQCDFATAAIEKVLESDRQAAGGRGIKTVEALPEAEDEWADYINEQNAGTLFPLTQSWWTGANIPGKKQQMLTYLNGLVNYEKDIRERLDRWEGFDVRYWDGTREIGVLGKETAVGKTHPNNKADSIPVTEHVEYTQGDITGATEAVEILRPTLAAT